MSSPPVLPRRRTRFGLILLAGWVGLMVIVQLSGREWEPVASVDALRRQEVIYRPNLHLFLVSTPPGPVALLDGAQHVPGEHVLYCPSAHWFVGRHGEHFDSRGRYADGPALRDLDRVPVRVSEGLVEVRAGRVRRSPGRSLQPDHSAGPVCGSVDEVVEGESGFAVAT